MLMRCSAGSTCCSGKSITDLAVAVRSIRQRLHLTQQQFAKVMLVTRNSISRQELGAVTPSLHALLVLRKFAETPEEMRAISQAIEHQTMPIARKVDS
jgi:DNA-binding transcriptional regulator YiaG